MHPMLFSKFWMLQEEQTDIFMRGSSFFLTRSFFLSACRIGHHESSEHYGFQQSWLEKNNLKPDMLFVMKQGTNLLESENIQKGDVLLVNRESKDFAVGAFYAAEIGDTVYIGTANGTFPRTRPKRKSPRKTLMPCWKGRKFSADVFGAVVLCRLCRMDPRGEQSLAPAYHASSVCID